MNKCYLRALNVIDQSINLRLYLSLPGLAFTDAVFATADRERLMPEDFTIQLRFCSFLLSEILRLSNLSLLVTFCRISELACLQFDILAEDFISIHDTFFGKP